MSDCRARTTSFLYENKSTRFVTLPCCESIIFREYNIKIPFKQTVLHIDYKSLLKDINKLEPGSDSSMYSPRHSRLTMLTLKINICISLLMVLLESKYKKTRRVHLISLL